MLLAVLGLALLGVHVAHYFPLYVDDALIALRYAQRLLHGSGLTWTDGERVEGYSSLLWVLLCAALGRTGVDLIVAARLLGILATVAALGALFYRRARIWPVAIGATALAASGPVAAWASSAMEGPLVFCLFAWALALVLPTGEEAPPRERILAAGACFAALCLTRPDAPSLVVATAAGLWWTAGLRPAVWLALPPLIAVLGQLSFRLLYYHDWVPNTATAKVAFSRYRLGMGAEYLAHGALSFLGLLLIASLLVWLCRKEAWRRKRAILLLCPLLLWVPYVVVVGGDFMPAHRFLLPALVVLIFMSMDAADAALDLPARPRRLALTGITALVGFYALTQVSDPYNLDAVGSDRDVVRTGEAIGHLLDRAFARQRPLVAVDAAGGVPYYSGLPALDMLGLTDRWIAHHPPPDRGHALPGHDLGSGAYVLGRAPDLILSQGFRSEWDLVKRPEFHQLYERITLQEDSTRAEVWVRKEGRVGIQRSGRRIVIPGFLFATAKGSVARWDARRGRLVAALPPQTTATVHGVSVPADWDAVPPLPISVVRTSPTTLDVTVTTTGETLLDELVL
jgi:hypothetical protein